MQLHPFLTAGTLQFNLAVCARRYLVVAVTARPRGGVIDRSTGARFFWRKLHRIDVLLEVM